MHKRYFLMSIFLCIANVCHAQDSHSIQNVVSSMRNQFKSIESLEMDYTEGFYPEAWKNISDPGFSKPRFCVCSLKIEGDKYYSETGIEGSHVPSELQGQMAYSIDAFDLKKYQILSKVDLTLSVTERRPQYQDLYNPPVLRTFSFLHDDVMDFNTVKNDELWAKLENTGTISETLEMIDGRQCVVLSIMDENNRLKSKVFCDIDNGYYPIRHEVYADLRYPVPGQLVEVTSVSNLNKIKTPEGDIYIPVNVKLTFMAKNDTVSGYLLYKVDMDTLSVNKDIPDEVFTIQRSMARNYEDRDNMANSIFPDYMLKRMLDKLPELENDEVHNHTSDSTIAASDKIPSSGNDVIKNGPGNSPAKTPGNRTSNKWIYFFVCGVFILIGWYCIKKTTDKIQGQ